MSNPWDPFVVANVDGPGDAFYKKYNYQFTLANATRGPGAPVLTNFLYAEKFLYGRVDRYYVPISPTRTTRRKGFRVSAEGNNSTLTALGFVVDAFEELTLQFQKNVLDGKISREETYLTAPKAHKAYQDPKLLYGKHFDSVLRGLRANFTKNNKTFKDFDEFIPLFMSVIKTITKKYPYTYPAYVKHRLCPITVSGLAIEIASLDFSNDEEKMRTFVQSRNWEFYLNTCRAYGFIVDMHAPWRMVADIGSSTMIEYARKYGMRSTDSILNMAMGPVHLEYYNGFKRALIASYSRLKVTSYLERQYCQNGTTVGKVIVPKEYSEKELEELYEESFFLELYLKIRLMEEESEFTESEQYRLINDAKQLYRSHGASTALTSFERVIGKTYDYSGSLTNADKGVKLRREESLRKEELRGAVSTYR